METGTLVSYFAVRDLSVAFRQFRLSGVSLRLERGQTLVLLGPSGAGKSVLLETVAGFHAPVCGRVELGGRDITALPPEERRLGFMFQDYALFPHLTVEQNVAFGLRGRKEAKRRGIDVMEMVGIRHLMGRRPTNLSGGEKQRVALARALAIEPSLFLFDEPLSALDAATREEIREELRRLLVSLGATSLYVTHDQTEALVLADILAIIHNGVIRQVGRPQDVFAHPADSWVAAFLGMEVLHPHQALPLGPGRAMVRVGGGTLDVPLDGSVEFGDSVLVFRPEDVHLKRRNGQDLPPDGTLTAVVESVIPLGPLFRIRLVGDEPFSALLTPREYRRLGLATGDAVFACFEPADLFLVPETGPNPGRKKSGR